MNDEITITLDEYKRLLERDKQLYWLEMLGIQEWDGYTIAIQEYKKERED